MPSPDKVSGSILPQRLGFRRCKTSWSGCFGTALRSLSIGEQLRCPRNRRKTALGIDFCETAAMEMILTDDNGL
jgi:hypothetical protein